MSFHAPFENGPPLLWRSATLTNREHQPEKRNPRSLEWVRDYSGLSKPSLEIKWRDALSCVFQPRSLPSGDFVITIKCGDLV